MKRTLSPITIAAVAAGLALGAAGGAFAAAGADQQKSVQASCEQRAAVRTKLREAFRAERQKENVFRLEPTKRQEIAKPILDGAVKEGDLPAKARDRVLSRLGRATPPGRP
jgi:hypothetical protein